jgi:membrane protein YqaA with SNARE-associated domain
VGLAEVAALGLGAVRPAGLSWALLAAFTVGHVAAKVPWYLIGRAADRAPHPRARRMVERARAMLAERPHFGTGLLGVSAVTSVPPFHLASIAAGMVAIPVWRFLLLCGVGRALRFGLLGSVFG